MSRVASSKLKANLGHYLKAVRAGKEIIVTDRDQPIARLVPYQQPAQAREPLAIYRHADPSAPPIGQIKIRGVRLKGPGPDSLAMLRDDRDKR